MHLKSLYQRKLAKKTMIMETKKSAKAIIENKRFSLGLMGLSVAGALTLMSFEYRNFDIQNNIQLTGQNKTYSLPDEIFEIKIEKPLEPEIKKPLPPINIPTITPISSTPNPTDFRLDPNANNDDEPILIDGPEIGSTGSTGDGKEPIIDEERIEIPQIQPEFPGGLNAMYSYLGKNIKYPSLAKENNIQGTVYIQFIVEKDGSITDVVVGKGKHKTLDTEALRVVSAMPKWTPGKVGNKNVRVRFTLPVNFVLN